MSTQNLITQFSLCIEGLGACVLPLTFLSPNQRLFGHGGTLLFSRDGLERLSVFLLDSSAIGPMSSDANMALIEQDTTYDRDPFDSLKISRDNLIKLGYEDWFQL